VNYDIKLTIAYTYTGLAVGGRHIVCVMPATFPAEQRLIAGVITITPQPKDRVDRVDFFGNAVVEFSLPDPHDSIAVRLVSRVERLAGMRDMSGSTRLSGMAQALRECRDLGPESPLHFIAPSDRAPMNPDMTTFGQNVLAQQPADPPLNVAEIVMKIGEALNEFMTFDPRATTVDTAAAQAFSQRRGVCQDYSHIMIACLRGLGIPAAYVSGYLRTLPPEGQARLEGADAMHAWVRAWCGPAVGWLSYDPTNATIAAQDHIVAAHGRDYSDVAPIKGILRGSGDQLSRQSVDVIAL
jgi:transglutaminase-like putative cysteine protease